MAVSKPSPPPAIPSLTEIETKAMNQSHPDPLLGQQPRVYRESIIPPAPIVFLLDVDYTVLDNDRVIGDLLNYELPALRAAGQTGHPEVSAFPTN